MREPRRVLRLALLGALMSLAAGAANRAECRIPAVKETHAVADIDWAVRVIPLPHELRMAQGLPARADEICVAAPADPPPAGITALEILKSFARGAPNSRCRIRLTLAADPGDALAAGLAQRLRALPNADQAYCILGRRAQSTTELLLVGNTWQGVLYAARTLEQLVSPPSQVAADTQLLLPLGVVVDWPDIAERGGWGGNFPNDLPWMAQWKLNIVELHARVGCEENGRPRVSFYPIIVEDGRKLGFKIVPIILHLEQVARGGLKSWEDCYNTPSEERAKRSDSYTGLCMSNPRTRELIAHWLKGLASMPGVEEIMVWLSEDATPCFCERCAGKEPYELEVAAVVSAFRQVQAEVNPKLRLRLLTSQGSYPVNDKVLRAVPPDVGVTYYDGGRTYDSSHHPMIYPLLEEFARSGRWLGVYPQLTNSWRAVLPWTGPHFIHARMGEFARKGLACVIGFAPPSNRFCEFNIMAAAEFAWNHAGRTPREFARAYARRAGIADTEGFADWADKIGPVGWDIAGTALFLRLIYSPDMALGKGTPLDEPVKGGFEVLSPQQIEADLEQAREALATARRLRVADAIDETESDIASVKCLRALYRLSHAPADGAQASEGQVRAWAQDLEDLDQCAAVISTRLWRWGARMCARTNTGMPSYLLDTIRAVPQTADMARELVGARLGIADPHPEVRQHELGGWSENDFVSGRRQTLSFDATPYITRPGEYSVCFAFTESAYSLDPKRVSVIAKEADATRRRFDSVSSTRRDALWSQHRELPVVIPELVPGCRYFVEVEAEGVPGDAPPNRQTCAGTIGIRRNWDEAAVSQSFFAE
jgi:hypothetical protein